MSDLPEEMEEEWLQQVEADQLIDTFGDAAKRLCGRRPTDE